MSRDQPTRPLPVLPHIGDYGVLATYGNWRDRLAAWAIRFGTDAPVNHAIVYVGNGEIVEAQPGGARRVRLDDVYSPDAVTWSTGRLPLTDGQRAVIVQGAQAIADHHVGYGWLDLVAIAFAQRRLGRLVNPDAPLSKQPWWVRRIEGMGTLICSQLVDVCYQSAGYQLFADGRLPGLVSPGDLWARIGRPVVSAR